MAKKRTTKTDLLNNLAFRVLYDKFRLVAMNTFEWVGLPDGITERHIEKTLFEKGQACFFRDPEMSFMCLPCRQNGQVNVYGDPIGYTAYGFNYQRDFADDDCVIIENNKLRLATEDFIVFYVNKLAEIERTMDVNIKACKTPIVFTCDDKDVLTFKQIFQQVDGNTPALFADRNLNMGGIMAFDTKAKFIGIELRDLAHAIEGDLLTFLGQNNVSIEKKERLITDEANANNELIQSFFDLQMEARERACEAINGMYGLNISVKARQPVEKPVETVEKEGAE